MDELLKLLHAIRTSRSPMETLAYIVLTIMFPIIMVVGAVILLGVLAVCLVVAAIVICCVMLFLLAMAIWDSLSRATAVLLRRLTRE